MGGSREAKRTRKKSVRVNRSAQESADSTKHIIFNVKY